MSDWEQKIRDNVADQPDNLVLDFTGRQVSHLLELLDAEREKVLKSQVRLLWLEESILNSPDREARTLCENIKLNDKVRELEVQLARLIQPSKKDKA